MQKRAGTILPLRQRSVSKCWHQGRTQCRAEARWDTSVRCNILLAGDRLCGLVRRTEGSPMAPLRLWTDNSHEVLSQKLQKKRKMSLTSPKVYHHSTISQASLLDRCCNRGNDVTDVGFLRAWYRLSQARQRAAYGGRTSSQTVQGYHHRGCVLKFTTSNGRWRKVNPTGKETVSSASQCFQRIITDRVPPSLSLSSFLPVSMVTMCRPKQE